MLSPLRDTNQIKWRDKVTQKFGENPKIYARFGMKHHNGIDFSTPTGTPLYASFDGKIAKVGFDGTGYGHYVVIVSPMRYNGEYMESIVAHMSRIDIKEGAVINAGDPVGLSGNSGFSSGPHLHWGVRKRDKDFKVINYNNGTFGYIDVLPYIMWWE